MPGLSPLNRTRNRRPETQRARRTLTPAERTDWLEHQQRHCAGCNTHQDTCGELVTAYDGRDPIALVCRPCSLARDGRTTNRLRATAAEHREQARRLDARATWVDENPATSD